METLKWQSSKCKLGSDLKNIEIFVVLNLIENKLFALFRLLLFHQFFSPGQMANRKDIIHILTLVAGHVSIQELCNQPNLFRAANSNKFSIIFKNKASLRKVLVLARYEMGVFDGQKCFLICSYNVIENRIKFLEHCFHQEIMCNVMESERI